MVRSTVYRCLVRSWQLRTEDVVVYETFNYGQSKYRFLPAAAQPHVTTFLRREQQGQSASEPARYLVHEPARYLVHGKTPVLFIEAVQLASTRNGKHTRRRAAYEKTGIPRPEFECTCIVIDFTLARPSE